MSYYNRLPSPSRHVVKERSPLYTRFTPKLTVWWKATFSFEPAVRPSFRHVTTPIATRRERGRMTKGDCAGERLTPTALSAQGRTPFLLWRHALRTSSTGDKTGHRSARFSFQTKTSTPREIAKNPQKPRSVSHYDGPKRTVILVIPADPALRTKHHVSKAWTPTCLQSTLVSQVLPSTEETRRTTKFENVFRPRNNGTRPGTEHDET